MSSGAKNLKAMFEQADYVDMKEGALAYQRYHQVMKEFAAKYNVPLERVIACFVALSPNNDYVGNLRSMASVLKGIGEGRTKEEIKVSTYKHCRDRAYSYAMGEVDFLSQVRGLKILNFYHNVLCPNDGRWVTVDGHICAAWRGQNLTMKEALVKGRREYNEIADTIKRLAFAEFMLPNQYQAVLWFTRKRVFNVKVGSALQRDWLAAPSDMWKTYHDVEKIKPYD